MSLPPSCTWIPGRGGSGPPPLWLPGGGRGLSLSPHLQGPRLPEPEQTIINGSINDFGLSLQTACIAGNVGGFKFGGSARDHRAIIIIVCASKKGEREREREREISGEGERTEINFKSATCTHTHCLPCSPYYCLSSNVQLLYIMPIYTFGTSTISAPGRIPGLRRSYPIS